MAKKGNKGTNLDKNPFLRALKSSIDNADVICAYILNSLYTARLSDPRILALYTYFLPFATAVHNIVVALMSASISKKGATKQVELTEKGLQPFIHAIFLAIENVYAKGSTDYDRLLIGGTESFYGGSRNSKQNRLSALLTAIGTDISLAAAKALVISLHDNISGKITTQSTEKFTVKTDSASIKAAVLNAATAVWYVYFGLMMVYILTPATALAFLPMDFIYKAAKQLIKTVFVPKATIKKILSHLFKVGETVTIKNNGLVGLWVGLAESATSTVLVWYYIAAGDTVNDLDFKMLGNATFKFVMVKNADLTTAGDITFTINQV